MIPSLITASAVRCEETERTKMVVCHTTMQDASDLPLQLNRTVAQQSALLACPTQPMQVMVLWVPEEYVQAVHVGGSVTSFACKRIDELSVHVDDADIGWSGQTHECKKVALRKIPQSKKQRKKEN